MSDQNTPTTLFNAVLAFQSEAPKLQKDALNPHFKSKYLSLEALMEKVLPLLTKNGLVWITMPEEEEGTPILRYTLALASTGEKIEGLMPLMITRNDIQAIGSSITYCRRYTLMSVLGLVADEDDDGQQAVASKSSYTGSDKPISPKQRGLIQVRAKDLSPKTLADIILTASEAPTRSFESQGAAKEWVERALEKFPSKYMDLVLSLIERAGVLADTLQKLENVDESAIALKLVAAGVEDVGNPREALQSLSIEQLSSLA